MNPGHRATALVVLAVAVACTSHHATPTGPTPQTGAQTAQPISLTITGAADIAPGQTVSFLATAAMSDGSTQDYTRKVSWSAVPASVMTITGTSGEATAQAVGDVSIAAAVPGMSCCRAGIMRTVLPPNTYRLVGTVTESGSPVQGASMTVLSGVGTGLVATTGAEGEYGLYGVAGSIEIKCRKPGYDDIVKTFTIRQNDVLAFPEAHQTAGIPSLAGSYSLTITADPACPTIGTALPAEFRQPRTYEASLLQDGPSLTVALIGPQLRVGRNYFMGRVEPDSIEFHVGVPTYYGYNYPISEQLSATQQFNFVGQLHAERSGNAIVGRLDGTLEITAAPGGTPAMCVAHDHQVTMTRTASPSRHR